MSIFKRHRLVSIKEAAEFLDVSSPQIFNLISRGTLTKYHKPHRNRIYVDMDELEAYNIVEQTNYVKRIKPITEV